MSIDLLNAERRRRGIMPSRLPPPDTLTLTELAERAGITRKALCYHVRRGALRVTRQDRGRWFRYVVDRPQAERWLSQYRKHAPVKEAA